MRRLPTTSTDSRRVSGGHPATRHSITNLTDAYLTKTPVTITIDPTIDAETLERRRP